MTWYFEDREFTDDEVNGHEGFCYIITNLETGERYIGRKYFWEIRKVKGKKRRQRSESNWRDYYGSSERLKEQVKSLGPERFRREIVSLHPTRGDCNYMEVKLQFLLNVLEDDTFMNDNINGKWRSKPDHIVEARRIANNYLHIL